MKLRRIISIFSILLVLSLILGCAQEDNCNLTDYQVKDDIVILDKEGTIPCELCDGRDLHDKIIVLESKYCGACRTVVPIIKEVAKELKVAVTFLDLAENFGQDEMAKLKIMPQYTPTMVIDCKVYIGGKTKEDYRNIFTNFLEEQ